MQHRTAVIFLAGLMAVGAAPVSPGQSAPAQPHVAAPQPSPAPAPPPAAKPRVADEPVATVNGRPITREALEQPLIEAYGLQILMSLVQLELAKQYAAQANVVVTPADIRAERDLTLRNAFPNLDDKDYDRLPESERDRARQRDREDLLDQLLGKQNISRGQFAILMEFNAYLRRMAEPLCRGRISEDNVREAFNVMYGETVKVRDIQVSNVRDAMKVKTRLASGERFEDVAREVSEDPRTRSLGGEVPAFGRNSTSFSQLYRDVAFGMKEGEVSDPFETNGAFHVIKLEHRIAPRVVKFEDVKDSVRNALTEKFVAETMKNLRAEMARQALQGHAMDILDPVLKAKFDEWMKKRSEELKDEAEARRDAFADRLKAATRAAVPPPSTAPAAAATTAPASAKPAAAGPEASDRPPATQPGAPAAPGQPASATRPATAPAH